jgi:hypothetical protein
MGCRPAGDAMQGSCHEINVRTLRYDARFGSFEPMRGLQRGARTRSAASKEQSGGATLRGSGKHL